MPCMIPVSKILEHSNPWLNRPWDDAYNPVHDDAILNYALYGWHAPIIIEVDDEWIIWDGNHRLCAAVLRDDTEILAKVGGNLDYASELFGVPKHMMYEQA